MLVELAFASSVKDRRHVVILVNECSYKYLIYNFVYSAGVLNDTIQKNLPFSIYKMCI